MTGILDSVIQGMLTGFGSAIGTYFAFKYGIDHIEKIPLVKDKVREYIALSDKKNDGPGKKD
jgi:hypothetical protein